MIITYNLPKLAELPQSGVNYSDVAGKPTLNFDINGYADWTMVWFDYPTTGVKLNVFMSATGNGGNFNFSAAVDRRSQYVDQRNDNFGQFFHSGDVENSGAYNLKNLSVQFSSGDLSGLQPGEVYRLRLQRNPAFGENINGPAQVYAINLEI